MRFDKMGDVTIMPGLAAPAGHIEPNDELIERLESLLADAKTGQLVCLAYAAVNNHELIKTSWVGSCNRGLTGYALSKLHAEFYAAVLDDD